jgi:hypothetical protein
MNQQEYNEYDNMIWIIKTYIRHTIHETPQSSETEASATSSPTVTDIIKGPSLTVTDIVLNDLIDVADIVVKAWQTWQTLYSMASILLIKEFLANIDTEE